jgi:NADH:ubiquinone oxidoreductase subunit 5 (subunit L)/multisubunit Na+/H+ antiporter MnhA subunit/multisubunit Na+/H+ antiporter MnhB subunit
MLPILLIPFLILALATVIALLFGLPRLNARLTAERMGWILAIFPAAAFTSILLAYIGKPGSEALVFSTPWIPAVGIQFSLYLDGLSALFALIITGIGALVVLYAGYYFHGDNTSWRFQTYTMIFMAAMMGVVLAGDLITLFLFWEGTSISSFLLIGYKYKDEAARKGAFKSLFITGGGGIALLAGFVFIMVITGASDFATIFASGDALRNSPLYPAFFALIALGAFAKSAQVPAHIWLPDAMSAPTPASAFLHSATMVKAGIYLLARFNPVLGGTDTWFWTLTLFGFATMLTGAYLGLKQNDLKALLAYSTISQLGVLVALIGLGNEYAYKALVIGILAHALYKSSLFMSAGIIDHETGTRDLRRLGGLRKQMPILFVLMLIPALSMAGLPPLFGFLAKETLLAAVIDYALPVGSEFFFALVTVLAGAMLLAQSGLLIRGTFLGKPADPKHPLRGHDPAWGFWLAPAIPAFLSLSIIFLQQADFMINFLTEGAVNAYGKAVTVSLALWHGVNTPLILSLIAIALGSLLFWKLLYLRPILSSVLPDFSANAIYNATLAFIDRGAREATLLQRGQVRFYIGVMLTTTFAIVLVFGGLPLESLFSEAALVVPEANWVFTFLRVLSLLVAVGAALVSVLLLRDLHAIIGFGLSGLAVGAWMALEPAPDVALVQIVVDIFATIVLVLTLTIIPRKLRLKAQEVTYGSRLGLSRDILLSLMLGLVVFVVSFAALETRPRESVATIYYEVAAKPLANAADMVGAILIDFRGLDTLLEVLVFALAALGIYTIMHYTVRKAGKDEQGEPEEVLNPPGQPTGSFGLPTSPFLHLLAYALLPLAFILAVTHVLYGHDQPGDGFTAGIIISLGIASWYIIFGFNAVKAKLTWLKPVRFIGIGVGIALINTLPGYFLGSEQGPRGFFAPVNYGELMGLNNFLPTGVVFGNGLIFEIAICLVVMGASVLMLDNFGHPAEKDAESDMLLSEIGQK